MRLYYNTQIYDMIKDFDPESFGFTDVDRERVLLNPNLKERLNMLLDFGKDIIAEPIYATPFSAFKLFSENGDRSVYESSETIGYFCHRKHLMIFGLLAWLYPEDKRYLVKCENAIWAILDEYTWCLPAHLFDSASRLECGQYTVDLFAAETGSAISEILNLLGDRISPLVRMRAEYVINERIISRATDSFGWNTTMTNNWASVCAGNVLLCAAYQCRDKHRLASIISTCMRAGDHFLRAFAPDGACLEGISYWGYGVSGFVLLSETLKALTNGKINLLTDEKVKNIALFHKKCVFPFGRSVSFSDGGSRGGQRSLGLTSLLASYYPEIELFDATCQASAIPRNNTFDFCRNLREFVWAISYDPAERKPEYGTYILSDAKWYISTSENLVSIAAKAGHNAESHNHNDVGSFQLFKNGEQLLLDFGAGDYSGSYFSGKRYSEHYNCCSRGHSVPIINGTYQHEGGQYAAKNTVITEDGLCADIARAYTVDTLTSLVRDIGFDRASGKVTLTDTYEFTEAPESVTERFITGAEPIIEDGVATVTVGNESVKILFDPEILAAEAGELSRVNSNGSTSRTSYLDLKVKEPKAQMKINITVC